MALKKCKECDKEISTDAKVCPQCGKPQPKRSPWGCAIVAVIAVIIFMFAISNQSPTTPRTPPVGSDPATATDEQIYREFEVCMNEAKKTVGDDKLKGQAIAGNCMLGLKKYGDKRAQKAFKLYFNL
ncbi:MAG: hypothetical protein NTY86_18020 [Deltaproteobacteria bacterium]|nr:hypothetical protein [Deltaproteobacteria bacterium]